MSFSVDVAFKTVAKKIIDRQAVIGIFGLGYVGLPLAQAVNRQGYHVIGYDPDDQKIKSLQQGRSYIKSLSHSDIQQLLDTGRFEPMDEASRVAEMDIVLICVPTPLTRNREPDMSYVQFAAQTIAQHAHKNHLIILESTTYPGTTRELLTPIFEERGFKIGEDFFLAYSPEREDPGNGIYQTSSIPKVVGSDDPSSSDLAVLFYEQIVPKVIQVTCAATAEAVKLTENIFRFVNIALVNELKTIYDRMGIDIWEVVDAAKSKPFGYMPFYPGPGLGGHCIPIDPFYLTWKAREYGISTQFIELSGYINGQMAAYIIERLREQLDIRFGKGLKGTKILILGMAYKKNVEDMRESPALTIFTILKKRHATVEYYDAHIPSILFLGETLHSIVLTPEALNGYDAVVICTDHDDVDYQMIVDHGQLIIDTRNATKKVIVGRDRIVKA